MTTQAEPTPATDLPTVVDGLAATITLEFQQAQGQLMADSAALVKAAIASPAGSAERLMLAQALRQVALDAARRLQGQVPAMVAQVMGEATSAGRMSATTEVKALGSLISREPGVLSLIGHAPNAARLIQADLASSLSNAAARITRFAYDAYRAATVIGATAQIIDKQVPASAQRITWDQLTGQGITGFTDKAGRRWNLATYTEMAVRTATQRAYNASHQDRLTQMGVTYFTLAGTGRPCPLCAPWEGKVLAASGAGTVSEKNARTGAAIVVHVAGTIEDARAAGVWHPNCKHVLAPYAPGVTVLKPTPWDEKAEAEYRNTQKLRAMEASVRREKQQAAAALNDVDRALHQRRARAIQANIRKFTTDTGLLRRPRREQLHLGNDL